MGKAWEKTSIIVYHAQNTLYLQFTRWGRELENGVYLLLQRADALGVHVSQELHGGAGQRALVNVGGQLRPAEMVEDLPQVDLMLLDGAARH